MNLITYAVYIKNNFFNNKKFLLIVSLATIFLLFFYFIFIDKVYSSSFKIKILSLSDIKTLSSGKHYTNYLTFVETSNEYRSAFGEQFDSKIEIHNQDKIFYNIINNIQKKNYDVSFKRTLESTGAINLFYTAKIKANNLDTLEKNKENLFTVIKLFDNEIKSNLKDYLNKMLYYIDYRIKFNEIISNSNLGFNNNSASLLELEEIRQLRQYSERKKRLTEFSQLLETNNFEFIKYDEIEKNIKNNTITNYFITTFIAVLIWAITILIGNIVIFEHQRYEEEKRKKEKEGRRRKISNIS
jgi:hypothetical protein